MEYFHELVSVIKVLFSYLGVDITEEEAIFSVFVILLSVWIGNLFLNIIYTMYNKKYTEKSDLCLKTIVSELEKLELSPEMKAKIIFSMEEELKRCNNSESIEEVKEKYLFIISSL